MKPRNLNRILLAALLCAAGMSQSWAADPVYQDQDAQKLSSDYSQTITENWAFRPGSSTIAMDGYDTTNSNKRYKISFAGQTKNEYLLFDQGKRGISGTYASFESLKSLVFKGHSDSALYVNTQDSKTRRTMGLEIKNVDYVEFSGNGTEGKATGGAINVTNGSALFENINTLMLNDNMGIYNGGALIVSGDLTFNNVGFLQANNNIMDGRINGGEEGGAIGVANSDHGVLTRFLNNGKIEFRGNQAIAGRTAQHSGGGAIHARCELSFMGNGDVGFYDNIADDRAATFIQYRALGGAIRVLNRVAMITPPNDVESHRVDFSADRGNIEFKGNRVYNKKSWGDLPRMSSVAAQAHQFNVRAQDGYEVRFYDPIDVSMVTAHDTASSADLDAIYFNAPETDTKIVNSVYNGVAPTFTGTIRFSGEFTEDIIIQAPDESDDDFADRLFYSRYNQLNGDIHQEGGSLVVEHRAVVGLIMQGFHYTTYAPMDPEGEIVYAKSIAGRTQNFNEGAIQLTTGGTIMGPNVNIGGSVVWKSDGSGHLISRTIDWSQGAVHDFDYSLKKAIAPVVGTDGYALIDNGVIAYANTLSLGGDLKVADDSRTYASADWKGNKKFLVVNDIKASRDGSDFDGILTTVTGTPEVRSPYTYKGTWSLKWEDDELYALWTYLASDDNEDGKEDGDIEEVEPELMGELTENSLWMTGSNMKSLSRMNHRQMGISRLYDRRCSNFWLEGIGDFINQGNKGKTDGFDYNGGGYAVGYDTRMCPDSSLAGISFGQIAGTGKNRRGSGSVDQNTLMANIYGGYIKEINDRLIYSLTGTAGFGRSHNKMHTVFSSGDSTYSDWNNDAWLVDVVSTWDYKWDKHWTVSPFVGLEFTRASHGSFTEWGSEKFLRHFDSADMSYLRMPVGLTFKHLEQFSNQKFWVNSLSLSYLPDLYRNDPDGKANALINDFVWDVNSASPSRNALRVELNSYYRFTEKWGVYAGYSLEARSSSTYQQVNLGMNFTF